MQNTPIKLDKLKLTNPYLILPEECYTRVEPTPLKKTFLIHTNEDVGRMLDIDTDELKSDTFIEFVNGVLTLQGSDSFAMLLCRASVWTFCATFGRQRWQKERPLS